MPNKYRKRGGRAKIKSSKQEFLPMEKPEENFAEIASQENLTEIALQRKPFEILLTPTKEFI